MDRLASTVAQELFRNLCKTRLSAFLFSLPLVQLGSIYRGRISLFFWYVAPFFFFGFSVFFLINTQDQPWSAQDERQICGRAHRQPQKKEVHCYHLLADETSDIILSSLARGKKDMMEAFLQKQAGQGF
jgi:hypothetical protein